MHDHAAVSGGIPDGKGWSTLGVPARPSGSVSGSRTAPQRGARPVRGTGPVAGPGAAGGEKALRAGGREPPSARVGRPGGTGRMRAAVLTGSPGTGKHTAAKAVAAQLGLRTVDLNAFAAEHGLCEYDAASRTSDVDAGLLAERLRGSGALDGGCLVVGHLAPYALDAGQVGAAVVLRRSPYELEGVYAERGYAWDKAAGNLGAEILGVAAHDATALAGPDRTVQVDTTGKSPEETARAVALALGAAGEGRAAAPQGDRVDWLSLVAERGDLGRFFPPGA